MYTKIHITQRQTRAGSISTVVKIRKCILYVPVAYCPWPSRAFTEPPGPGEHALGRPPPSEADPLYVRRRKWAPHGKFCCASPFARKLCLKVPLCFIFKCASFWSFRMSTWRDLNLKDFGILGCPEAKIFLPAGADHSSQIGVLCKRYAQGVRGAPARAPAHERSLPLFSPAEVKLV